MKRTALKRRTPLRARRPWRPRRRRKPVGVIVSDIWREGMGGCEVCRREGGKCKGPVQAHHIIRKATLIALGFSEHVMDKRNRLAVCEYRHEQHTTAHKLIPRELLPASVFEFAEELGLGWYLDRHYPVKEGT